MSKYTKIYQNVFQNMQKCAKMYPKIWKNDIKTLSQTRLIVALCFDSLWGGGKMAPKMDSKSGQNRDKPALEMCVFHLCFHTSLLASLLSTFGPLPPPRKGSIWGSFGFHVGSQRQICVVHLAPILDTLGTVRPRGFRGQFRKTVVANSGLISETSRPTTYKHI